MPDRASHYIHGTTPEEQRRLTRLNQLLNQRSLDELALRGGESILDLGSGLGQLTRAMARVAGRGARVVGIERSEQQLEEARRQAREAGEETLAEFRQGDVLALSLAPAEWGSFDVAHARFVLEHVSDPLAVVRAMVRAVRPGGRLVLVDDDHDVLRLWPEPAAFSRLWGAYCSSYERASNDPYVGRRMIALLHQAGAQPRRNRWVWFGSCSGDERFPLFVANLVEILIGARAAILEAAGETEAEGFRLDEAFDAAVTALRAWGERPDAAIWFAMAWAEGVRER
ncbi:MAG TPA: methyltransferase domain-containing protein [Candidatus Eisenbacteria bacterium]|jgi:SAM-dependent methyltransferase